MRNKTILLSIFLLFSFSLMFSQSFTNIKVNHITDGDQDIDGGNTVAVSGDNVYVLWTDYESTFKTFVSKSTNGGESFGDGVQVAETTPQVFAALAAGIDNSVYVAWCGIDAAGENPEGIYFVVSSDGAESFNGYVTISPTGFYPQVAVHNSYIYVFFLNKRRIIVMVII